MQPTIIIEGLEKVSDYLTREKERRLSQINNAIHKQGFNVEAEVKESIAGHRAEPRSVDTGRFLNSVNTNNSEDMVSVVSTPLDYPKFLEHGTVRIEARHHFDNSLSRKRLEIQEAVRQAAK